MVVPTVVNSVIGGKKISVLVTILRALKSFDTMDRVVVTWTMSCTCRYCATLRANARHPHVASLRVFATAAEISAAYEEGCVTVGDETARLQWTVVGPRQLEYPA